MNDIQLLRPLDGGGVAADLRGFGWRSRCTSMTLGSSRSRSAAARRSAVGFGHGRGDPSFAAERPCLGATSA